MTGGAGPIPDNRAHGPVSNRRTLPEVWLPVLATTSERATPGRTGAGNSVPPKEDGG